MLALTRRQFAFTLCAAALGSARTSAAARKLDFEIKTDGFEARADDIRAVVHSAADAIWQHCTATKLEFGFRIYRNERHPITHFEREDERIIIGLATRSTYWAQYAFQFAHEFCHALMDHANDWRRLWRETRHANHWVEETLCETGSLFALRAMGRTWKTEPPYAHWSDYASKLTGYTADRLEEADHQLPPGKPFREWLAEVLPEQRLKWTRARNTIVARELLPLFEAEPAGWDAIAALNLCERDPQMPLPRFLEQWQQNARALHRAFIGKISELLAV